MSLSTNKLLEKFLNFSVLKQKVINNNIANAGTIGYRREDVRFDNILNQSYDPEIKVTNQRHIKNILQSSENSPFEIIMDPDKENFSGVNNVDVDREMAEMAENTIMFKFAARKLNTYYKSLQKVIKGGS